MDRLKSLLFKIVKIRDIYFLLFILAGLLFINMYDSLYGIESIINRVDSESLRLCSLDIGNDKVGLEVSRSCYYLKEEVIRIKAFTLIKVNFINDLIYITLTFIVLVILYELLPVKRKSDQ